MVVLGVWNSQLLHIQCSDKLAKLMEEAISYSDSSDPLASLLAEVATVSVQSSSVAHADDSVLV